MGCVSWSDSFDYEGRAPAARLVRNDIACIVRHKPFIIDQEPEVMGSLADLEPRGPSVSLARHWHRVPQAEVAHDFDAGSRRRSYDADSDASAGLGAADDLVEGRSPCGGNAAVHGSPSLRGHLRFSFGKSKKVLEALIRGSCLS